MLESSRTKIYDYVESVLEGLTENVYRSKEPQELTDSDTTEGFVVIRLGELNDASEFSGHAYGWIRVFVDAYIPPMSRGRLDTDLYSTFEDGINEAIQNAIFNGNDGDYYIQEGSILSMDDSSEHNANNFYHVFVRSFIVVIDKEDI